MPDNTQGGRENFRLLYPPHTRTRAASLPDSSFFHTLQIDQMVSVRRESWRGLPDLRLEQFFTTDTDVLAWRLDVVADLVESEALRSLIKDALPMLRDAAEMRKVLNSSSSTVESSLASVWRAAWPRCAIWRSTLSWWSCSTPGLPRRPSAAPALPPCGTRWKSGGRARATAP